MCAKSGITTRLSVILVQEYLMPSHFPSGAKHLRRWSLPVAHRCLTTSCPSSPPCKEKRIFSSLQVAAVTATCMVSGTLPPCRAALRTIAFSYPCGWRYMRSHVSKTAPPASSIEVEGEKANNIFRNCNRRHSGDALSSVLLRDGCPSDFTYWTRTDLWLSPLVSRT